MNITSVDVCICEIHHCTIIIMNKSNSKSCDSWSSSMVNHGQSLFLFDVEIMLFEVFGKLIDIHVHNSNVFNISPLLEIKCIFQSLLFYYIFFNSSFNPSNANNHSVHTICLCALSQQCQYCRNKISMRVILSHGLNMCYFNGNIYFDQCEISFFDMCYFSLSLSPGSARSYISSLFFLNK